MRLDRHVSPLESSVMLRDNLHPYVHGGGFGIATEILANSSLADVLKTLEPHRFMRCDRILDKHKRVLNASCAKQITLSMENSPVIAALAQIKLGMAPVKQRVASRIPSSGSAAGALLPLTTSYADDVGEHGQEDRSELTGTGVTPIEWDVWLDPKEPESLEKAVIEHGSLFATLFGGIPFMRSYFLKSAPSVIKWVSIYGQAISRFNAVSDRKIEEMPSICLDIKSAWSTAAHIDRFIRTLKQTLQVNVCYVGSFTHRQIAQVKESETILFCHAVWDLQKKVASGFFSKKLMINGADLEEGANLEILRGIVAKHNLDIGIYVQEPEAGTKAIQRLIEMVNSEPELFKLGFALGNSRDGRSSKMINGSGAGIQKILLTNGLLPKMQRAITQIGLSVYSLFTCNYRSRPIQIL